MSSKGRWVDIDGVQCIYVFEMMVRIMNIVYLFCMCKCCFPSIGARYMNGCVSVIVTVFLHFLGGVGWRSVKLLNSSQNLSIVDMHT